MMAGGRSQRCIGNLAVLTLSLVIMSIFRGQAVVVVHFLRRRLDRRSRGVVGRREVFDARTRLQLGVNGCFDVCRQLTGPDDVAVSSALIVSERSHEILANSMKVVQGHGTDAGDK